METKLSNLNDMGRYVYRGGKKFETRQAESAVKVTNFHYDEELLPRRNVSRLFCCGKPRYGSIEYQMSQSPDMPDVDFCADSLVKLSNGITAYRLTEPSTATNESADSLPLVICLHDMTNSSYMWADVVDLLADCDQGPQARVLVFDFYGRGRSPYIGVPCTLDVFVLQIKELLECKYFISFKPLMMRSFAQRCLTNQYFSS